MAMNRIQFQHGMSLPEFLRGFGTEAACAQAVMAARWPNGFECPKCGEEAHCVISVDFRPLFQCNGCRRQTSVTAGTLFAGTKLPLTTWFLAIYLISQAKTGLSALALKRQLGVSYRTAWLVNHKIMCAMAEREDAHQLTNVVQMDVAAVSVNEMGHPVYLKLTMVAGFTRDAIKEWANLHLAPGTVVISDGLGCFAAVSDAGCVHMPTSSVIACHATCPNSPGSTPSWAISRRRWQVPTTHSTTANTPPTTSLPSPTGSTVDSICTRSVAPGGDDFGVVVTRGLSEPVLPGVLVGVEVSFPYDVSYAGLSEGARFRIMEGERLVGDGRVLRLF